MFECAGFTMLHNFCCRGNYKLGIYGVKLKTTLPNLASIKANSLHFLTINDTLRQHIFNNFIFTHNFLL